MSGRIDMALAFAAAVSVHVGVLAFGVPDGGGGGGEGGVNRLSLSAAAPELAALVREWERPPEVSDAARPVSFESAPDPLPDVAPETGVARLSPGELAANPPVLDAPTLTRASPPRPHAAPQNDTPLLRSLPDTRLDRPASPPFDLPIASLSAPGPVTEPPLLDRALQVSPRPPERPMREVAAVATRRAEGTGQTGKRGTETRPAPKASEAARQAAAAAWASSIERRIAQYHSYPRNTRDEGRVRVAMVILPDGRLRDVSIARSSGSGTLDHAAVAAVKRAAPFPAAPNVLTDRYFKVGQWIVFSRR